MFISRLGTHTKVINLQPTKHFDTAAPNMSLSQSDSNAEAKLLTLYRSLDANNREKFMRMKEKY